MAHDSPTAARAAHAALKREKRQSKADQAKLGADKASGKMAAEAKDSATIYADQQAIKSDKKVIEADKVNLKADQQT